MATLLSKFVSGVAAIVILAPLSPQQPWTRAQLADFKGDLMIYAPEIGCAPEARIVCRARGLQAGWVWTITLPRFNRDHRAALLQKAKAQGWTHYAVQVTACRVGSGYHDLYPVTADDCAQEPQHTTMILEEVRAAGLIPVCAGVGPDHPVMPGLDLSLCPIALNDWDNSAELWGRLKLLASSMPGSTLLYVELPSGSDCPRPSGGDEPIVPSVKAVGDNGPRAWRCNDVGDAWRRAARARWPNFSGVLHELDAPGSPVNDEHLKAAHAWFGDMQEVNFESDTYWKFWDALNPDTQRAYNDDLMRRYPWLKGCMSGCSTNASTAVSTRMNVSFSNSVPERSSETPPTKPARGSPPAEAWRCCPFEAPRGGVASSRLAS
jgi:hypothetical protein